MPRGLLLAPDELMAWVILANVALFGIPTLANWLSRRRKRRRDPKAASLDVSLSTSYGRVITYMMMGFGGLLVVWGALFLFVGLLGLATKRFYPLGGYFLVAAFCLVGGLVMIRFFRARLRKGPNAYWKGPNAY